MAEFYSQLPQNANDAKTAAKSSAAIREIRQLCENAEVSTANDKLNALQVGSYHFQLLVYLILDELPLAKYLYKRVRKEVKQLQSFNTIWDIGISMWKSNHNDVYKKISSGQFDPIHVPFIVKLENNYRLKQVKLVSKAYTSITIKELMINYLGFKDIKQLTKFINSNGLQTQWIYDNTSKPTYVNITPAQDNYSQMLDAKLLSQFTRYVCFMESQQKLTIDEINAATNSSKN